ncbi:MAG: segregation and condensation protein A [Candidatus Bruticola sp.]
MPLISYINSAYRVQIEQFEGPLDLLLHLVCEAKLDITEISLAAVANQYFQYLEHMKSFNIEIESSYLLVFAQLLELKSRLLLPDEGREEDGSLEDLSDILDQQSEDDNEADSASLVRRLKLYAMVRQGADWLSQRERICASRYVRPASNREADSFACELQVSLEALTSTFQRLSKAGRSAGHPITLSRVSVSVPERIAQLERQLKKHQVYSFWKLIGPGLHHRSDIVVTFLALLQMVKEGKLHVEQAGVASDLQIYL